MQGTTEKGKKIVCVPDVVKRWIEKDIIAHLVWKRIGYIVKKIEIFIEKIIYAQNVGKLKFLGTTRFAQSVGQKGSLGESLYRRAEGTLWITL